MKSDRLVETVGGASLTSRAKAAILASVVAGRFKDGRLPSEPALATLLGVSRTTARAALQSLEQDGLLVRAPGRGTSVRPNGMRSMVGLQQLVGFANLLEDSGHAVSQQVAWKVSALDDAHVTAQPRLKTGQRCFIYEKLLLADGEPAIWLRDIFPVEVFSKLPRPGATLPDSTFEISDAIFLEPIDHAFVEVVPAKAGGTVATLLRQEEGEPYVLLREAHYSERETFLGVSEIHLRDRFLRFQLMRRR
jgi:GntR family transcriptional regulator